jgi:hypothetical protein
MCDVAKTRLESLERTLLPIVGRNAKNSSGGTYLGR